MPIKLPKGFPRRKSSGNVLDEVQNNGAADRNTNRDSASSFRVLARPQSGGKPLESGSAQRLNPPTERAQPPSRSSYEPDNEDLFSVVRGDAANRGSGGTSNSLSTAQYDSGASSSRLSTSSTNPSSVDTGSTRNVKPIGQRSYDDIPAPPPPSAKAAFLKNAGRTFSFGINRNSSKETNDLPPLPPVPQSRRSTMTNSRDRAMTISSVTTATAPRLEDSSFSLRETDDDDFGNMFANIHRKNSRENLTSMRPAPLRSAARAAPPQPIHVNSGADIESSPYSWHSQNSRDGLIGSPSPSRTVTQASPQPSTLRNTAMDTTRPEASQEDNMFSNSPLRQSPAPQPPKHQFSSSPRAPPSAFPSAVMPRGNTQSSAAARSPQTDSSDFGSPTLDPTLFANAQLANRYEEKQSSPVMTNPNKIMTPAEFERYKQQKEDTRRYNKVFGKADSDDGSGDDYDDDEDDQEREQQAVKQRKKQEAHLAVYRQQMMKVTGDATPTPQERPGTSMSGYRTGNSSQLDLSNTQRRMSSLTVNGNQSSFGIGKLPMDNEEEDEDVPLGILAAHGFPSKNKPPTRLAASSSNPNLRNLAQTQSAPSVAEGEAARGLPAFARHLPADPYFGAGLVHQTERTPLSMHPSQSQTQLAAQPQPSGAATAHPLHPAGLVGVIAGEERARAMRRGSPNPQGGYDMPTGRGPQQMPPHGMMMQPPMLSPAEQAQIQMSQDMNRMMQMQMQWMQQMAGMMTPGSNMQMPMMNMPGMPQMQQNGGSMMQQQPSGAPHRPQSVPLQSYGQPPQQRTMSTLAPSMAGWHQSSPAIPQIYTNGTVYAPSIAPSERSNIGLAQRYRPVATATQEPANHWQKRASTFSSATFRPWTNENSNTKTAGSTIRNVQRADDDDDEQGWADMKARKDKKQKSWKLRKGGKDNSLQELYNAPA